MRRLIAALLVSCMAACAARIPLPPNLAEQSGAGAKDLLLLGEQHDADVHRRIQQRVVESLAGRGRLAALALEMAEQGASTAGLSTKASEEEVRSALRWNESGWPWRTYAPVVMQSVRAAVPVLGANLPRAKMREAMGDSSLDALLTPQAFQAQQQAIRRGHCGLLPESQITPMTRIQIARDRSMAQVLQRAAVPGKTVVLIAGSRHVDTKLGIPQHLPAGLRAEAAPLPPQPEKKDYCEEMRNRRKTAAPPAM
jgi:uncharacterized iron-regulated protein